MKAYKVFNPDWTCLDFQYKVGETYEIDGKPIMCNRGFHACKKIADCFNYYSFDSKNKVAEVELSGIILGQESNKQCCSKITIVKELSWHEVLTLANSGTGNTGNWNSGNWNSGDSNSGNMNSGDMNSGDSNSGYMNSGDSNSGDSNSGDMNSGDRNSGDWNSGNRNSGDWNSGDWNSGDWNSGDWNSGFFNSTSPEIVRVFNKDCDRVAWENAPKPKFISNIILNKWVYWSDMTDEEKKRHPDAFASNGYLKTYGYQEAWKNAYNKATKEDIELLKALPNFDPKVFEEITGIKV